MHKLPIRKTLEEEGMYQYLERTGERHNDYRYRDLLSDMKANVSVAASARKAHITDKTMKGWRKLVAKERERQTLDTKATKQEFTK